jgi:hypothetical protein
MKVLQIRTFLFILLTPNERYLYVSKHVLSSVAYTYRRKKTFIKNWINFYNEVFVWIMYLHIVAFYLNFLINIMLK